MRSTLPRFIPLLALATAMATATSSCSDSPPRRQVRVDVEVDPTIPAVDPTQPPLPTPVPIERPAPTPFTVCTGAQGQGGSGGAAAAVDPTIDTTDPTCSDSSAAPCTCDGFTSPDPTTTGLPDSASYTDNGDGTVTDDVTGLIWETRPSPTGQQCPTHAGETDTFSAFECNQAQAAAYCASRGSSWRLPTMRELVSLLDWTAYSPSSTPSRAAIRLVSFPGTPSTDFWTSTRDASDPGQAWSVDFFNGSTGVAPVTRPLRVRCVSPSATPRCYSRRYQIRTAGEISDAATGLTWQQTTNSRRWNDATTHCPDGWRLPSLIELQTIVDDRTKCPTIDPIFAGTPATFFWTASSSPEGHWYVDFALGGVGGPTDSDQTYQVRCVR